MTRTPLRVSFAGGGTDLPDFCEHTYGAVWSTAIDKYVYVTVKRHTDLFHLPRAVYVLRYSKTETVESIDEIENNIARECLRFLRIQPPIYISTVADLPASTGLGGSSSFAVGLLHALHTYLGERVSAGQLAQEACHIELEVLKEPIGRQDQYAAAFGGLNFLRFNQSTVSVEPQGVSNQALSGLFDWVMMFWTGVSRDASAILSEQNSHTRRNLASLLRMRDYAQELQALTDHEGLDPIKIGRILHESWQLKRELASSVSTDRINRWYAAALAAGAEGGKLCGAGGGGFLLFVVRPDRQPAVRQALDDLIQVTVSHEVHGSRVVLPSSIQ